MSIHDNGTRLCLESLLGRIIDRDEAHEGTAFLSRVYRVTPFEDVCINIHALDSGLVIRVHQGVDPHRYVEMTIPRDLHDKPVEFITSENAITKCNQEVK
jgi:hypothetical protein